MKLLDDLRLANVRNGLAYPHDDLCYFQSNYGHRASLGYFRIDAMPLRAIVHLLCGRRVTVIDGTSNPRRMSDALTYGVPTWCAAFNIALGHRFRPCGWITGHAMELARSPEHRPLRRTIQKLAELYDPDGAAAPLRIAWSSVSPYGDRTSGGVESGDGPANVFLESHQEIAHDDRPTLLRGLLAGPELNR